MIILRDLQSVSDIIEDGLTRFDINFPGWSGLVRKTSAIYGLDDPLELMQQPWRSDRWRLHCKNVITKYWIDLLHEDCQRFSGPDSTLDLFDVTHLTLESPHPVWVAAMCDSISTSRATYVMWLLLGVYNTGKRLFKMGKARSPSCAICQAENDDRVHFILSCSAFSPIRDDFLCQLVSLSPTVSEYMSISQEFLLCILDPFSPRVPCDLRESWTSKDAIYKWSRNFCYSMHKRRTQILESISLTTT